MDWVNAVVQGLLLGGLYALFATGLSLLFGVMRLVNLAHGDLAVLAAFGSVLLIEHAGMSPFLTLVVVVPAMALLGYLLQRLLFDQSLRIGPFAPLLATFGLSVVIENALQQGFGANQQRLNIGSFGTSSFRITSQLRVGQFDVLVFAVAVAVLVGLQLMLSHTQLGRVIRATGDDARAASLCGVNGRQVYAFTAAIAVATVAVAGVLLGMRTTFVPTTGSGELIFAFEAVVIGGLGSLWGTLVGGLILGVAQTVGAQINPADGLLAGHLVFLAVLAIRPQGILRATVTA
jgi:branched-chain amino acid transport system permease protein